MTSSDSPSLVIYRSSAGSGKTYTLVKEYLKIILNAPDTYKNILAVTFTNKAAAEMKQRIINSLDKLAKEEDPVLKKQLIDEGVSVAPDYLSILAREILVDILHNYTFFSVQTIDSFFYSVIRSFAREIGLYMGTRVQLDTKYVLDRIVDELLRKAGDDERLTSYFEDYILYNLDENKTWHIDRSLKSLGQEIFKERYQEKLLNSKYNIVSSPQKLSEFKNELYETRRSFEDNMMKFGTESEKYFTSGGFTYDDFPHKSKSFMKWMTVDLPDKKFTPGDTIRKFYDDRDLMYRNIPKGSKQKLLKKIDLLFRNAVEYYDNYCVMYNTIPVVMSTIHTIGIFEDIVSKLKEYMDSEREILISEFNPLLRSFVLEDASPFIFEKIGNSYRHFLIDEAQDTSTFQWDNLKPLAENSMSEGGRVVIVGDVKQSIYRWRNGNMNLLLNKIKQDLERFTGKGTDNKLDVNRRSRVEIIDFVNNFMRESIPVFRNKLKQLYDYEPENTGDDILSNVFGDFEQGSLKEKTGGYINVSFIDSDKAEDENEIQDDESETENEEGTESRVLEIISSVKALGYNYSDITILARYNISCYNLAVYLLSENIPVVSSESLLIANSPKIRLIIALLRLIVNHKDEYIRLEAIFHRIYYLYKGDVDLSLFFSGNKKDLGELVEKTFPKSIFTDFTDFKINGKLAELSIYEIIENIIRIFELSRSDGGIDAFVTRFLDAVLEYTNTYSTDVNSFLEWWELNGGEISISLPESLDAVKIMTIHKAKGLQNKIVILPYAEWRLDPKGGKDHIWVSSDKPPFDKYSAYLVPAKQGLVNTYFKKDYCEEGLMSNIDNLNLLYVAMTRAEDHLYIIAPLPKLNNGSVSGPVKNVSELLYSVMKINKLIEDPEKRTVEIGSFEKYKGRDSKHIITGTFAVDIEHSATGKDFTGLDNIIILPRRRSLKLIKDRSFQDKTNLGTLVHETLYRMRSPEDYDKTEKELEKEGYVNDFNRDSLRKHIKQIFLNETVKGWFGSDWEVKAEQDILMPDGNMIRPDRVIIKDNKPVIIDWKTGIHKEEEHFEQLRKYANALTEIGYDKPEMYIYNFLEDKIITVSYK